jgi:WD40 repeat protein
MDASICVWDLSQSGLGIDVQPLIHIPNAHKGPIEDVDWHKTYEFLFGSAGDDRNVYLWDDRQNSKTPSNILEKAHAGDVHCISFNERSEFLLATGGADKTVKMWDLRKLREMVHCFEGHKGDVQALCWSPFEATKLASSGTDRRVIIWDMEKIGFEQDAEDAADGAPELMFAHGGHSATVSDLSWNLNQQHVFASVDNDNMLHIWQPANVSFFFARFPLYLIVRLDLL